MRKRRTKLRAEKQYGGHWFSGKLTFARKKDLARAKRQRRQAKLSRRRNRG